MARGTFCSDCSHRAHLLSAARFAQKSCPLGISGSPRSHVSSHAPAQLRAQVRREFVAKVQIRGGDGPTFIGIENHKIRIRARQRARPFVLPGPQAAPALLPSIRPAVQVSHRACASRSTSPAAPAPGLQFRPRPGPSGLSSRRFMLGRARGVVGRHHVDQTLFQRLPKRFAIRRAANRRRAFVFRCAVGNLFRGKPKIMHASFHGDGQLVSPRRSEQRQRLRRRQMHDVDWACRIRRPAASAFRSAWTSASGGREAI